MTDKPIPHPFVAPCREVPPLAPLNWLKLGFDDTRRAPFASLALGSIMTLMLSFLVVSLWSLKATWLFAFILLGLVFLAPMACIGTYAVSAQLERHQPVSFKRTLRASVNRYLGNELVFALAVLIVVLVWARASSMVSIFMPETDAQGVSVLSGYVLATLIVATLFLSLIFAASVFALPMLMHRNVDAITAIISSINAVLRNKSAMFIWALTILFCLLLGALSAGLLLVVILPTIGHAVWHGYLNTLDVSEFPRHEEGITSTPRIDSK